MIGDRIREIRTTKGWTQSKLSELSGVSLPTIRSWEQGKSEPLFSNVVTLADLFGVSLDAFRSPPGSDSEPVKRPMGRPKKTDNGIVGRIRVMIAWLRDNVVTWRFGSPGI